MRDENVREVDARRESLVRDNELEEMVSKGNEDDGAAGEMDSEILPNPIAGTDSEETVRGDVASNFPISDEETGHGRWV